MHFQFSKSETFQNLSQYRSIFTVTCCYQLAQTPSWRTTICRLSTTAYSIYSQLHSILEDVLSTATRGQGQGQISHDIKNSVLNKNGGPSRNVILSIFQDTCLRINPAVQLDCWLAMALLITVKVSQLCYGI
jgi:hypothetical protein